MRDKPDHFKIIPVNDISQVGHPECSISLSDHSSQTSPLQNVENNDHVGIDIEDSTESASDSTNNSQIESYVQPSVGPSDVTRPTSTETTKDALKCESELPPSYNETTSNMAENSYNQSATIATQGQTQYSPYIDHAIVSESTQQYQLHDYTVAYPDFADLTEKMNNTRSKGRKKKGESAPHSLTEPHYTPTQQYYLNKITTEPPMTYNAQLDNIVDTQSLYIRRNLNATHEVFYNKRYLGNTSQLEELYGVKNESMDTCPPGSTSVQILARPGQFPLPSTPYGTHILRPMYNIDDLNIPLSDGQSSRRFKQPCCECCCTGCIHVSIPLLYLIIAGFFAITFIFKVYALIVLPIGFCIFLCGLIILAYKPIKWRWDRFTHSEAYESVTFPLEVHPKDTNITNSLDINTIHSPQDYMHKLNEYKFIVGKQRYTTLDNIKQHINSVRSEIPVFAFLVTASHTEQRGSGKSKKRVTVVTHRKWVHVPIMAYNSYGEQPDDFINRIVDASNGRELMVLYKPKFHFKAVSSQYKDHNDNTTTLNTSNDTIDDINNIIIKEQSENKYISDLTDIIHSTWSHLDRHVNVEYSPYTRQLGIDTRKQYYAAKQQYKPRTALESAVDLYSPYDMIAINALHHVNINV